MITIIVMSLFTQKPRRFVPLLLILILAAAAGLRFDNLNWDNGIFAHPDERSTVAFYAPTIHWPENTDDLLNPHESTLNPFWDVVNQRPRSYTYGHFPLYMLVLISYLLNQLAPLVTALPFALPDGLVHLLQSSQSGHGYAQIGRGLMALADVFTVYLVFLLGRRLYGVWGGLLAAALSAFTVLQIQLAHFFAVDPLSTTFTLLALYGAILMYDRASLGSAILTGVGIGLAVSSKFSALPIAFAPVVAGYLAVFHYRSKIDTNRPDLPTNESPSPAHHKNRILALVVLALAVSFVIFAVTSPFVLLDFENFRRAVLDEQGNMVSGVADMPFTRQYRGTLAYWYFIQQQIRWGMGWPLGLLAFGGLIWVVIKAVRGKALPGEWIILSWIIFYFGPTGLFLAKFMRYMIPVVPLFTLFGAGMAVALWRYGQKKEATNQQTHQTDTPHDSAAASPTPAPPPPRTSAAFSGKLLKVTATAIAGIALVGAIIWSLAFVNGVYGSDHTWVIFARWVYANVRDGSCLAVEHWDDRQPTDLPEPRGTARDHNYNQPILPMYDDDTQQKYEFIRDTLRNCDYVVLASNRLWRTIPRLPERYPMSTRYYEALFSGELGFEPVYAAETPPQLGPLRFDDQPADESFTVYDHPKPYLFKKNRQLSEAEWDAILGGTWEGAVPGYVGSPTLLMRLRGATRTPALAQQASDEENKSLLLPSPVDQLPVVSDFRWNSLANHSMFMATVIWWLLAMLIGLIAWPVTFLLFHRLPDRGYGLSKSLGLLLIGYFVWINSSLGLLGNRLSTVLVAIILLTGVSIWLFLNHRRAMIQFLAQNRRFIVIAELVFTLVFLFFVYLRLLNPDLWQPWLGGEKMLEIGFLNAILKSAQMPPYDPFFAGGIINYYYYGLFLVGVLIKLSGIQPAIAFNLAVPTLAALTAINVFSLGANLAAGSLSLGRGRLRQTAQPSSSESPRLLKLHHARPLLSGLLAILFVVFISNLEGAGQFLRELARLSVSNFRSAIPGVQTLVLAMGGLRNVINGEMLATYNYWDPTRVIPATINEFPYFSFLFADLHPHMIGIPFTVLVLSLAYNWLRADEAQPANGQSHQMTPEDARTEAPVQSDEPQSAGDEPPPVQAVEPEPVAGSIQTTVTGEPQADSPPTTDKPVNRPAWPTSPRQLVASSPYRLVTNSSAAFIARWLALPFVLGALGVINTWDLPTYLGLLLATFLLGRYRRSQGLLTIRQMGMLLLAGLLFAGALLGVTYLLYLPFFVNYHALDVGLGLVYTQTALDQHLKIWGFFLLIIVTWLGVSLLHPASRSSLLRVVSLFLRRWNVLPHLSEIYCKLVKRETDTYQLGLWSLAAVLIIAAILALLGYRVPAYLLPLVVLSLALLFRRETSAETAYVGVLTFTGLLVLLGVEFFFLRDFLGGGEYYRMNTLFKFFTQVWVIFGLVAAVVLPQLWEWAWRWSLPAQFIWRSSVLLLLLATLIYPILGTRTRVDDRFPGDDNRPPIGTLNGLAYMTVGSFDFEWPPGSRTFNRVELGDDLEAIRWLQNNVSGTPVIAEAKVGYYREGGMRVAAYTGLPSILGGLHQNEQRYASQVDARDLVVNEFWTNPDPNRTLQLIDQLDISYIYIGQLERIVYGDYIDDKFEQLRSRGELELVFENEKTKIYKRIKRGLTS